MPKRFTTFITRHYRIPADQLAGFLLLFITFLGPIVVLALTSLSPLSILLVAIFIGMFSPFAYRKFIVRRELLLNFTDHISMFDKLDFKSYSPNMTSTFVERITILYDNKPVSKLHTVLLKIENIGNTRIEELDFQSIPLVVTLPKIPLMSAEITVKHPDDINATLKKFPEHPEQHKVIINPFSLPVGGWFHIRFTFDFANSDFSKQRATTKIEPGPKLKSESAHDGEGKFDIIIYQQKDWEEKSEKRRRRRFKAVVSALTLLSILAVCLWVYVWFFPQNTDFTTLPYQLLAAFIVACLYFGIVFSIIINRFLSTTAP